MKDIELSTELLNWKRENEVGPELEAHYVKLNRWHWFDITCETTRVNNFMFGEEVEDLSPRYEIFSAACFAASEGAFAAVAACLGVAPEALYEVVFPWYENQDEAPPPIKVEDFVARINLVKV